MKLSIIKLADAMMSKRHERNLEKQWKRNCRMNGINPSAKVECEDEYLATWSKFGGKVEPYSCRLFSHYGLRGGGIVPESQGIILERYLNPRRYIPFYSDKNLFSTYLGVDTVPETLIARINGSVLLDKDFSPIHRFLFQGASVREMASITSGELADYLKPNQKVCLKPSVDSSSGQGVELFALQDGAFRNKKGVELNGAYLVQKGHDFVMQKVLVQHPYLCQFNPSSVNTIRLGAYRSVITDEIIINGAYLKIGAMGAFVDNSHAGGRFVGVDVGSGKLQNTTLDQYGVRKAECNGIDFSKSEFVIPNWNDIIDFAKEVAGKNHHMRLQSMDICLDENGVPKVVEVNVGGFSWWGFMYCGQDVLRGEVESVIEYCSYARDKMKPKIRIQDVY